MGILCARYPPSPSRSHLHMITVPTLEEAIETKERLRAGIGFAALARALSRDEALKANGGDVG